MNLRKGGRADAVICAMLLAVTLLVFCRIAGNNFILYDDNTYLTENPTVKEGLTWKGVAWAFTTFHTANWHPLTWLSHMLDVQLFGMEPGLHHLMSLLIHAASALLLFLVLRGMTGALWPSAFTASLFAVHPLHVESVAWAAERKDVLSAFFWMATAIAWLGYLRRPCRRRYLASLALFGAGLLAKPMLVTLPLVFLLLDAWPLRRLALPSLPGVPGRVPGGRTEAPMRLVAEKIPLLALTAASSIVTAVAQGRGGAMVPMEKFPFHLRVANAAISYVRYLWKSVWPADLVVFYPHEWRDLPVGLALLSAALLSALTLVALRESRRRPYLFTGWFWYLGTLVPVIGLVQVGVQSIADRYTYLPLIGIFMASAWLAEDLTRAVLRRKLVLSAAAAVVLGALSWLSWVQAGHWKDSMTLFRYTVSASPGNWLAEADLGDLYDDMGNLDQAIIHYREVLKTRPMNIDIHNRLGIALSKQGQTLEAVHHFGQALRYKPDYVFARNNLGVALMEMGNADAAIAQYRQAIKANPGYMPPHSNLADALVGQGKLEEASGEYREALRLEPGQAEVRNSLGAVLFRLGRFRESAAEYREALRLRPSYADARYNLGLALEMEGKPGEAAAEYVEVLKLQPGHREARARLGGTGSRAATGDRPQGKRP